MVETADRSENYSHTSIAARLMAIHYLWNVSLTLRFNRPYLGVGFPLFFTLGSSHSGYHLPFAATFCF